MASGVLKNAWERVRRFGRMLGPGVITGASDNDPAGISTYTVAGARTGYTFLWLSLLSLPVMIAVQDMSARIGAVRREGLGQAICETYGRGWLTVALIALIISNITTMGADLAGMSAALQLLTGIPLHWFVVPVALLITAVQVLWSYRAFANYLKYLTLVLFAYVAAGILSHPNWREVARYTFIPHIRWDRMGLEAMVGVLGTTVSPYMFFWQASEEVEEIRTEDGRAERSERWRLIDTVTGMFYAMVIFFFIVLTSGATLYKEHLYNVESAAQAAQALKPIAGDYTSLLFAIGLVGSGLIAVPVLAGSIAYPAAEWLRQPEGLGMPVRRARWFYATLAASVAIGMAIALLPVNPIDALFYSQVLMGLITPILLVSILLISRNSRIMGQDNVNRPFFNIFGWLAVALLIFADAALVWTLIH